MMAPVKKSVLRPRNEKKTSSNYGDIGIAFARDEEWKVVGGPVEDAGRGMSETDNA